VISAAYRPQRYRKRASHNEMHPMKMADWIVWRIVREFGRSRRPVRPRGAGADQRHAGGHAKTEWPRHGWPASRRRKPAFGGGRYECSSSRFGAHWCVGRRPVLRSRNGVWCLRSLCRWSVTLCTLPAAGTRQA